MNAPIPWRTDEILEATRGVLVSGEAQHLFSGVSIDSRTISGGEVFVAIKGDVHDGHRFIPDVIARGITGVVADSDKIGNLGEQVEKRKDTVFVAVDDTTRALGDLAAFHRRRCNASVVAITGSNGKTSTRKMTGACAAERFKALEPTGNFNNQIGLPLTLLKLEKDHEWAVLELGMNRPGEIGRLAEICMPDIGVITNIGPAHLEGLGSMEGIMEAKGELLEKIRPEGTAVLNADDPRVMRLARRTAQHVMLFGLSEDAAVRAISVKEKGFGTSFTLVLPEERVTVDLKLPGAFMVSNALAAAAVGCLLGLPGESIKSGLENFEPAPGRMNILKTEFGMHIIDDTYNANPGSMEAAIRTLDALKGDGRGVVVVGDMLELGEYAESMHRMIGALISKIRVSRLYATGAYADAVAAGATDKDIDKDGDEDMDIESVFTGTKDEILSDLTERLQPDDWVLVKGSNAMGMEEIVRRLLDWADARQGGASDYNP